MGYNITDATCFYGLAQTSAGCSRTLASYNESAYFHAQLVYLIAGVLSVLVTGIMYYRTLKYDAPMLQQRSFLLGAVGSITFFLRGIDPSGFRHIVPRPIVLFFSDACTCALYAIFIFALGYWATIIQQTAAHITRPLDLRWVEFAAIAVVFVFYLIMDMATFATKGFHASGMTLLNMLGSAAILAVIAFAFLVYGVQVHNRLTHFEKQRKIFNERNERERAFTQMETGRSFDLGNVDDIPVAEEHDKKADRRQRHVQNKNSPSAKIRKIIYVVESFCLIVVAGQVYMGIANSSGPDDELDCANGLHCDDAHASVSIMHWLQLACIWIIVWIFRKIEKKAVVPGEPPV